MSMSSKYKLPVSLRARGSDMIRKFYTQVSKIVALIITLVGTTNWESSRKMAAKQSTLGSAALDTRLENIILIILSLQNIAHGVQ